MSVVGARKKKPYSAAAFYVMGNANLFALLLLFFLGKRYEAPLKKLLRLPPLLSACNIIFYGILFFKKRQFGENNGYSFGGIFLMRPHQGSFIFSGKKQKEEAEAINIDKYSIGTM